MYRIWLMSVPFGPRRFVAQFGGSANEHIRGCDSKLKKSWKDQKSFLLQFSLQELLQIDRLTWFLISTADWAVTAEETGLSNTRDTCQHWIFFVYFRD